jgi:hypothetical protein
MSDEPKSEGLKLKNVRKTPAQLTAEEFAKDPFHKAMVALNVVLTPLIPDFAMRVMVLGQFEDTYDSITEEGMLKFHADIINATMPEEPKKSRLWTPPGRGFKQ